MLGPLEPSVTNSNDVSESTNASASSFMLSLLAKLLNIEAPADWANRSENLTVLDESGD